MIQAIFPSLPLFHIGDHALPLTIVNGSVSSFPVLPGKNEVHLWLTPLSLYSLEDMLLKFPLFIAETEINISTNFRHHAVKKQYLLSRILLRKIISQYCNCASQSIDFKVNQYGKPALATPFLQNQALFFSMSHSHDLLLIGFSTAQAIGVDIEQINLSFDWESVADFFLSKQERQYLQALPFPQQTIGHYAYWTLKEAVVKCLGVGLHFPLKEVSVKQEQPFKVEVATASRETSEYSVLPFQLSQRYTAAFALASPYESARFFYLKPEAVSL